MHINAIKSALVAADPYFGQLQPLAQPSWGTAAMPEPGITCGSGCSQHRSLEMPTAWSWPPGSGPDPKPRVRGAAPVSEPPPSLRSGAGIGFAWPEP